MVTLLSIGENPGLSRFRSRDLKQANRLGRVASRRAVQNSGKDTGYLFNLHIDISSSKCNTLLYSRSDCANAQLYGLLATIDHLRLPSKTLTTALRLNDWL